MAILTGISKKSLLGQLEKIASYTQRAEASDGARHKKAQTRRASDDATRRAHVRASQRAPGAGLLRTHRQKSPGAYRALLAVVRRTRTRRANGDHAPSARTLATASVPLPQEKR